MQDESGSSLLPALADRRARRAFDGRSVPEALQTLLWEALRVAPSHGNCQPWRILVAASPETRAALDASLSEGNRSWALAAPLIVAIAANPEHARAKHYGPGRALWSYDSGIATGNLMAQATALGLIAHPMTAFDEERARAAFGAPEAVRILSLVAIGYPGSPRTLPEDLQEKEIAPRERLPLDHIVVVDRWQSKHALSARELRDR